MEHLNYINDILSLHNYDLKIYFDEYFFINLFIPQFLSFFEPMNHPNSKCYFAASLYLLSHFFSIIKNKRWLDFVSSILFAGDFSIITKSKMTSIDDHINLIMKTYNEPDYNGEYDKSERDLAY